MFKLFVNLGPQKEISKFDFTRHLGKTLLGDLCSGKPPKLSPAQYSLTVHNRDLKQQSFHAKPVYFHFFQLNKI